MKKIISFSALLLLVFQVVEAQTFTPLNTIYSGDKSAFSSTVIKKAQIGARFYFVADDGIHGTELWQSDGTASGTTLLADIYTGLTSGTPNSSYPDHLMVANGALYFTATDGMAGVELWRYIPGDPTPVRVAVISDPGSSDPDFLTYSASGNCLYFTITVGGNQQLYRFDINTGINSLIPVPANIINISELRVINNAVYFVGFDNNTFHVDLYRYNGINVQQVGNINPANGSVPTSLTVVGDYLYFSADADGTVGRELWYTHEPSGTTGIVSNIYTGANDSNPAYLTLFNGTLYFSAEKSTGKDLFKVNDASDPTQGVTKVGDINTNNINPTKLAVGGTRLYFEGSTSGGRELRGYDPVTDFLFTTSQVSTGTTFPTGDSNPQEIVEVGGMIYFKADDDNEVVRLYRLNPAAPAPITFTLVKDIVPYNLFEFNGALYFLANDGTHGMELWKSTDGTLAGTDMLKNIRNSNESNPDQLTTIGNITYFTADDGSNGRQVWQTDGTLTPTGTHIVDMSTLSSYNSPDNLTNINGVLYFSVVTTNTNGDEIIQIRRINGNGSIDVVTSLSNTSIVSQVSNFSIPQGTNILYFSATHASFGTELWRVSVATIPAGSLLTSNINPISGASSNPQQFTDYNGVLYFTADNGSSGIELWKRTSTAPIATTQFDIMTAAGQGSNPGNLIISNNVLYFAATDGSGRGLWKIQGTNAPVRVTGLAANANPSNLIDANGTLYFTADDGSGNGLELWRIKADGSAERVTTDIPNSITSISNLRFNNNFYFAANNGTTGNELWKITTPAYATSPLKDIYSGASSSNPANFTVANGWLYFTANNGTNGEELWKTDGTAANTVLANDFLPGLSSGSPRQLTFNGTNLLLLNSSAGGIQLQASGPVTPPPTSLPLTLLEFNGRRSGRTVILNWTTSLEINTREFIVERSTNGTNFTAIGQVAAQGNSSNRQMYQFNDVSFGQQKANTVLYRLRMVDQDDSYSYSKVVTISQEAPVALSVYPNPASNYLNLMLPISKSESAILTITDANGKQVLLKRFTATSDGSNIQLSIEHFAAGTYFIKVATQLNLILGKTSFQKL